MFKLWKHPYRLKMIFSSSQSECRVEKDSLTFFTALFDEKNNNFYKNVIHTSFYGMCLKKDSTCNG